MQTLLKFLAFLAPYGTFSYFVMFGVLIACGFGLPLPEDVVLISGGILAARGITKFWIVFVVCMAGVLIGDGTIFMIGRRYGPSIKSKGLFRKIFSEKNDKRVMGIIQKWGDKVIFMARFMPGLRTPIFLTCGTYQVKPWKFVLLDGTAALISVPVWIWVGYVFGANLEELERMIRKAQIWLYLGLAAVVAFFVLSAWLKRRAMRDIVSE